MYLIKVEMDRRSAIPLLADCQQMHRFVTSLFGVDRKTAQVLYRTNLAHDRLYIYLYANMQAVSVPENCVLQQRDMTSWLNGMSEGDVLSFELVASPSKKIGDRDRKNSQRRILREPILRQAWMEHRAELSGFELLRCDEVEQIHITGKHREHNGGTMYHDAYRYCGVLRIVDATAFRQAMQSGIGPGRAYGFGMLMVKPL